MTNPPPPGNWGPPQPPYGQGQPPYGPGQWPPQQQGWGQPPAPPKNNLKWLLIGVAVLLVIAISVGATLLFTRDSGGGTTQTATGNPPPAGEIASANDTGPVSVITEDPTCDRWRPIATTLANLQSQGWEDRDFKLPATAWTPEQRGMHEEIANAMRAAADQTVALAKATPHRVVRELYEQSIAYWRAYADSIPTYTLIDNSLAVTASDTSSAVVSMCAAIQYKSAAARAPLVTEGAPPDSPAPVTDVSAPSIFLEGTNAVCEEWTNNSNRFDADTTVWREGDTRIPASDWTPQHRSAMDEVAQKITAYADSAETLARASGNPTLQDFAALSAQYWRAFVAAIPTYTVGDGYLSSTAAFANLIIFNACAAQKE